MTIEPVPLSSSIQRRGINMLVHGPGGSGKTILAGSHPKTLILEADDGSDSAAIFGSKAMGIPISGWDSMDEAFEYIKYDVPKMPADKRFQWVWLDGITLFFDLGLGSIMVDLVEAKSHRKLWAPDKGEYGQNMNRLQLLVRNLAALPINVGFTAHSHMNEEDGRFWPAIQGKDMPMKICGWMQVVAYLEVGQTEEEGKEVRVLRTDQSDEYYAKDRFGSALGGRIVAPTVPKIEAKIMAKLKATTKNDEETF